MQKRMGVTDAVLHLLSAQAGTVSREQALEGGMSYEVVKRLVRDEQWSRTTRGVFRRGVADPTFEQVLWSGILLAGEPSAIGGAAALHRLGVGERPGRITIFVEAGAKRVLPPPFAIVRDGRGRLGHRRGGPALIRVEDAILDESVEQSLEQFVGCVTDATRLKLTVPRRIDTVLRLRERQPRKKELLEVLADLQGIESNLEFVYRRDVERAHDLPRTRRQVRHHRSRFDMFYDEYGIVIEVDGKRGHVDGRFRDFRRDNEHAAHLAATLRYGSFDIRAQPCAVAAQVAATLHTRGWQEDLSSCPRCPELAHWQ